MASEIDFQTEDFEEITILQSDIAGSSSALVEDTNEESILETSIENNDDNADKKIPFKNIATKKRKEPSAKFRPLNLPLSRVKQIMKMDPDLNLAGSDAVFSVAKATELFIEVLSKDAYKVTASSKKKTIQKKDIEAAILSSDALCFLDGMEL